MNAQSALVYPFVSPGAARNEHELIGWQLDRLDAQLVRGQMSQAAERCQYLLFDFEGHFAFEELLMARIDFPRARAHRAEHADLLVAIARLLRSIRGATPIWQEQTKNLRQHLSDIAGDAHLHVIRQDSQLQRFAARTVEIQIDDRRRRLQEL